MASRLQVIAHNIRSSYNVGAVFRISDGAGVDKIYLTGYTPAPHDSQKDKFLSKAQKMLTKTALGAEKYVSWEKVKNLRAVIERLKKEGFQIIALEKEEGAIDFKKFEPCFPCALILGNEVRGVDIKILNQCDAVISIPMRGKKESLNVATAAALGIYELLK